MPKYLSASRLQEILLLAWPLMLSNITVPLLGLVDTYVIGHLPHPGFLGAVAIGSNIFMFLYFAFNFLRMGTTGLAAQYAQGDPASLHRLTLQGLLLALIAGTIMILASPAFLPGIIALLGGSELVQHHALVYCSIRIWGAPAALMNFVFIGMLIGLHYTRGPLILLLTTNLLNMLLDVVLVMVLDWNVRGAAWASVIADWSGTLTGWWLLSRQLHHGTGRHLRLSLSRHLLNTAELRRLTGVHTDIFIRTLLLLFCFLFFTAQGARQGDTVLAANAVLINFLLLISNALDGFANAAEATTGKALGQKNLQGFYQAVAASGVWSMLTALLLMVLFLGGGTLLIDQLTDITAVRQAAVNYLPWLILITLTASPCFWLDGVFVGATRTRDMRNSMILSVLLAYLPAWWFTQSWGNHGLWLAINLWMLARGLSLGWLYWQNSRHQRWVSPADHCKYQS